MVARGKQRITGDNHVHKHVILIVMCRTISKNIAQLLRVCQYEIYLQRSSEAYRICCLMHKQRLSENVVEMLSRIICRMIATQRSPESPSVYGGGRQTHHYRLLFTFLTRRPRGFTFMQRNSKISLTRLKVHLLIA